MSRLIELTPIIPLALVWYLVYRGIDRGWFW